MLGSVLLGCGCLCLDQLHLRLVCVCVRVLVSNANAAVSYSVQLPRKNNSVVVDNENTATKNKWQAFATVASHSLRDMHLLYLCVCSYLLFLD